MSRLQRMRGTGRVGWEDSSANGQSDCELILCHKRQAEWLTLIILVTWEAEIGGIMVPGQSWKKVHKTPSQSIKAGRGGTCLSFQLCKKCT
jgi:hypothetical protein